jgi:7,8-dihydropterin-6-yl-methyl-4-(beta-D-ribofuranosyl)aminobenzene 5'-phosphate synthase
MTVKITVLSENTSGTEEGLLAEHGLTLYIEKDSQHILFDTGQNSPVLVNNALRLGIDLTQIDAIVISHGHSDHAGGLGTVLGLNKREIPVHVHPLIFEDKYALDRKDDGSSILRDIGVRFTRGYLESFGARFETSTEAHEIFPDVLLTGQIPRVTPFEEISPTTSLRVRRDGELISDHVLDEHSIIIRSDNGLILLLGCCHPGLINTIEYAMHITGETRFAAVIGGTHLMFHSAERLQQTLDALNKYDIRLIGTSHCTGSKANALIRAQFGERFMECNVGTVVTLE